MTPTKKSNRGASTGLVLLVFSITALVAAPVGARATQAQQATGQSGMKLEVVAPKRHSLAKRSTKIAVTALTANPSASQVDYQTKIELRYEDHRGRRIPAPPLAAPGICHWGSDRAGACWVAAGETITFTRGVAQHNRKAVRRALRRGPVRMIVHVTATTRDGSDASMVRGIRLTR